MRIALEETLETTVLFICLYFVTKYLGNVSLRKDFFFASQFQDVACRGGEVTATGPLCSCSQCIYSQEAGRDECLHFLCMQPRTPAHGMLLPTYRANLPVRSRSLSHQPSPK